MQARRHDGATPVRGAGYTWRYASASPPSFRNTLPVLQSKAAQTRCHPIVRMHPSVPHPPDSLP